MEVQGTAGRFPLFARTYKRRRLVMRRLLISPRRFCNSPVNQLQYGRFIIFAR